MRSLFSVLLALFVINVEVAAEPSVPAEKLAQLAHSPSWYALLHYKSHWLSVKSEVNDEWFFRAENGRFDPLAELQADLTALYADAVDEKHFACQFPARAEWLTEQLQLDRGTLPKAKCDAWESYQRAMNAESVTLVYPVAYLNNPQSMFGHTFLLFNQVNETAASKAKSYTLNYAGKVGDNDSTPKLVVDGLFGGYKGVFNILPYEDRIKDYRDVESRGLWEYKLTLTQAETAQLVRHSWEIYRTHFDYYFLKTNCSYRLLGLLDVAHPGLDLENKLNVYAIPVDTVRVALNEGLVQQTVFQPAGLDYVRNDWAHLNDASQQFVQDWLALDAADITQKGQLNSRFQNLPATEQVYVHDLVTRYAPLNASIEKKPVTVAELPALSNAAAMEAPTPPERNDEGHDSVLTSVAAGKYGEDVKFQEIIWRPAFHSLTDPAYGYVTGTQIKVLETKIRHWQYDQPELTGAKELADETQVERVDVFDIVALFPRDELFKPTSWQFGLGAYRREVRGVEGRPMLGYMQYRLGRSYTLGSVLFYGLIGGRLDGGHDLDKGFEVGPNAELGAVKVFGLSQWAVALEQTDWQVSEVKDRTKSAKLTNTWNVGKQGALEISVQRESVLDEWVTEPKLAANYYF